MSNVPRIEGVPDPRQSAPVNKESRAPEDFRRMMKVEKSDETGQERKKKQAKSEEEEAELQEKEEARVPQTSFSAFLKDTKSKGSPFDVEGGKKAMLTSSEEEPPPLPSPFRAGATYQEESAPEILPPDESIPEEIYEPSIEPPMQIAAPSIEKRAIATPKKIQKEKPVQKAKAPEKEKAVKKAPPAPIAPPKEAKKPTAPAKLEKPKKPEAKAPVDLSKQLDLSEGPPPEVPKVEKKEEKVEESEAPLPPPKDELRKDILPTGEKKVEKEEKKKIISPEKTESDIDRQRQSGAQAAPFPTQEVTPITPLVQVERPTLPAYATLTPQVFELFEQMVAHMMIQQSKGISTTTVTLNMPNSVFHGSQIILEHYQTAPNSFNLQLQGSPRAVEIFNSNIAELTSAFQGAKLSFEVNIRTPVLLPEKKLLVRRKESTQEEQKEKGT